MSPLAAASFLSPEIGPSSHCGDFLRHETPSRPTGEGLSEKVHSPQRSHATDEGTQIFLLAIGGLLGLRINITGTISNVNPEGGI